MEFLLARIEPGKDDRDGRPVYSARSPQVSGQEASLERHLESFHGRIDATGRSAVAAQHAVVSSLILVFINEEIVLSIMIVDRRAKVSLRCRGGPAAGQGLLSEVFMLARLIGPYGTPVLPPVDARNDTLEVERIDSRLDVARLE
jgi:hypothetical protein